MKGGAMALVGTSVVPAFLRRSVLAQTTTAQAEGKKLVVIFQRGAADGLNIVVPHAETNYYRLRPTIAIPQNQLIELDGFFGLHPAMQSFKPLFDQGHLAMIHATGSPDTTRSHFDAQDFMESGTPGVKATPDGWLNRALQAEDLRRPANHTAFRAVALGSQVPRTLDGKIPAVAVNRLHRSSRLPTLAGWSPGWRRLWRSQSHASTSPFVCFSGRGNGSWFLNQRRRSRPLRRPSASSMTTSRSTPPRLEFCS